MKVYIAWCAAAVFLVHVALDLPWVRSLAVVGLVVLVAIGATWLWLMEIPLRSVPDEGDDGGGPEKHPDGALLLEMPPKKSPEWRA